MENISMIPKDVLPSVDEVDIESWTEEECMEFMKAYADFLQECADALTEEKKLKEELSKLDNATK